MPCCRSFERPTHSRCCCTSIRLDDMMTHARAIPDYGPGDTSRFLARPEDEWHFLFKEPDPLKLIPSGRKIVKIAARVSIGQDLICIFILKHRPEQMPQARISCDL